MDQLPVEILEDILSQPNLNINDVINFSSTARHYRNIIVNSSKIWKEKFKDNWPKLTKFHPEIENFYQEIQFQYEFKRKLFLKLEELSVICYKRAHLSDSTINDLHHIVNDNPRTYHYFTRFLIEIIETNESIKSIEVVPLSTPGNKTLQYVAAQVLTLLKQRYLAEKWLDFVKLPPKEQTLEQCAIFVAHWCQPKIDITDDQITTELDTIANLVAQELFSNYPQHNFFKTPEDIRNRWKYSNLTESQWSVQECRQIFDSIANVMYRNLGFQGNEAEYYLDQNSYINKVLETRKGIPIILSIIYESIARRLGFKIEPINFQAHFLLRYREGDKVYYIDTFNGGNTIQSSCPFSSRARRTVFPVATPIEVTHRIINNLEYLTRDIGVFTTKPGLQFFVRSVLELAVLVKPSDSNAFTELMRFCKMHHIDHIVTQNTVWEIPELKPKSQMEIVRKRPENLKYAVGMVMIDNHGKCVILDWAASTLCYSVLYENDKVGMVPERSLKPHPDPGLLHKSVQIARDFSHFFENHFVPNANKEKDFPEDRNIRHRFYHQMSLQNYKPQ